MMNNEQGQLEMASPQNTYNSKIRENPCNSWIKKNADKKELRAFKTRCPLMPPYNFKNSCKFV